MSEDYVTRAELEELIDNLNGALNILTARVNEEVTKAIRNLASSVSDALAAVRVTDDRLLETLRQANLVIHQPVSLAPKPTTRRVVRDANGQVKAVVDE